MIVEDDDGPHCVTEATCPYCGHWCVHVYPADIDFYELPCPKCGLTQKPAEAHAKAEPN